MKKVAVIIPTLNEARNIKPLIRKLLSYVYVSLIIIVDDSSTDGTPSIVQNLQKKNGEQKIILIQRKGARNFSESYHEGFMRAIKENADILVQMDADGSHGTEYLKKMLSALATYDFAIGSRYIKGGGIENWSKVRRILSAGANIYAKLLLKMPFNDVTSGYNAWKREVIESIDFSKLTNKGYVFQVWLKWNAHSKKFKGKEIPIIFVERVFGKSKMRFKMIFESFYEVFMLMLKKHL